MFSTQTPDHPTPPNACLLQDRLGLLTRVAALDLTLACSGVVYGLYLAKSLVTSGARIGRELYPHGGPRCIGRAHGGRDHLWVWDLEEAARRFGFGDGDDADVR